LDSIFDLHVHTREGSRDSDLAPEDLVVEARTLGLKGVLLAEHEGWQSNQFTEFARQQDLVLIHALEVYTDMGHVIALGLDGYRPRMRSVPELRRVVDEVGGFMIIAHPFRLFFGPHGVVTRNILFPDPLTLPQGAEEALAHPVFGLVDEVEVVNAGNDEEENRFAQELAALRGRPGTGGSDAHSVHGIGRGATLFHGDIRHERDFLDALRAGAYTPLEGYNTGKVSFYGPLPKLSARHHAILPG